MGFPPHEVDRMSLWQLASCVDGWNRAHGAAGPRGLTDDEFERAVEIIDATPAVMH